MQCSHFDSGRCRSCSELQQPYAAQLAAKQAHCRDLLSQHEFAEWLTPIASAETGFRNKAKMVVSGSVEYPVLGILDAAGRGVDLSDCALYPDSLQSVFPVLARFITQARIQPYDVGLRRGELKFLLITAADSGELMLRFVLRSEEPLGRIRKWLPQLQVELPQLRVISANLQPEHKAILEGEREIMLGGDERLTLPVNGLPLQLRPQSFFQTNTAIAAALYRQAREWVDEVRPATIWDLYCGVGGFALHCAAPGREVVGIEISAEAIRAAEQTRDGLGLPGLRFEALDATGFALARADAPQLVIVNPPRRGIGTELCSYLNASAARWLIYSSCNAESLARDLAAMPGFGLLRARVLDMFPHTRHYEVLTLLQRAG